MESEVFSQVSGELERLFDLTGMRRLSESSLGLDPTSIQADPGAPAFARALVAHCHAHQALPALVDAIVLSAADADRGLAARVAALSDAGLAPGTEVSGMRVLERIRRGGVSDLYRVERGEGDTAVPLALSVVRPEWAADRAAVHRFMTAARHATRITTQGLVACHAVGLLDGSRPWLALDPVFERPLSDKLRADGPLHISEALPILRSLLQGLGALHAHGFVHGDVTADTVLVVRRPGERDAVGLLRNAGVERLLRTTGPDWLGPLSTLTSPHAVAPELVRGAAPSPKSDLYAVGALAYDMLTGRPPFVFETAMEVVAGHLNGELTPPSRHTQKGWVHPDLDAVILRALSKDPAQRPANAEAFIEALEGAARKRQNLQPLDEAAFAAAQRAFADNVSSGTAADALEAFGETSGAWDRVVAAFEAGVQRADDDATRLGLLRRIAGISASQLVAPEAAAAAFRRMLAIDAGHVEANRGLEAAYRALGQPEALAEHLIERAATAAEPDKRAEQLRAAAALYESMPAAEEEALVVWLQVLAELGHDAPAAAAVERLCRGHADRYREALEALQAAAAERESELAGDDGEAQRQAEDQLALATQQAEHFRRHYDSLIEERRQRALAAEAAAAAAAEAEVQRQLDAQAALAREIEQARADLEAAEARHEVQTGEVSAAHGRVEDARRTLDALVARRELLEAEQAGRERALLDVQAQAREALAAYEALESEDGEASEGSQQAAMEAQGDVLQDLSDHAERLDEEIAKTRESLRAMAVEVEQAQSPLDELEAAMRRAEQELAAAAEARDDATGRISTLHGDLEALEARSLSQAPPGDSEAREQVVAGPTVDAAEGAEARSEGGADAGDADAVEVPDDDVVALADDDVVALADDDVAVIDGVEAVAVIDGVEAVAAIDGVEAVASVHGVEGAGVGGAPADGLTPEEQAQLDAVEALVVEAQNQMDTVLAQARERERSQARLALREGAAALHTLVARLQAQGLREPAGALSSIEAALALQPDHLGALDAQVELHRAQETWSDLVDALLLRADAEPAPPRARDLRTEAARLLLDRLDAAERARHLLEGVLEQDPDHGAAKVALEELLEHVHDTEGLASVLEARLAEADVAASDGPQALAVRRRLALLYGDAGKPQQARTHWEALLAVDPEDRGALKAVEQVYALLEAHGPLLDNLQQQERLAATPKQRIALLERVGGLQEEEFVDLPGAADTFERIIAIDGMNEAANTGLARIYRYMSRFEDVVRTLERQAAGASDPERKIHLLMQAERTLSADLSAPDRAALLCERALLIDPNHQEVLAELARLKSTTGQVGDAVKAVVKLAEGANEPGEKARQYLKAAELSEASQDRDGAIERYRLALQADPTCLPASSALLAALRERNDGRGLADALSHAIEHEQGDHRRAQLLAELGNVRLSHFADGDGAAEAFEKAFTLEPNLQQARVGLGRLAHGEGRHRTAAEHLAVALPHVEGEEAADIAAMLGASQLALGEHEAALSSLAKVHALRPGNLSAARAYTDAVAAHGQPAQAADLQQAMLRDFGDTMSHAEARALRLAIVQHQLDAGDPTAALQTLGDLGGTRDDAQRLALESAAHRALGDWPALAEVLQTRADLATDDASQLQHYMELGDLQAGELKDPEAAAGSYSRALEVDPEHRNALTKLMAVYSELRAWSRLVEVIVKIAEIVDAPEQLAKYYYTAGNIARRELGRFDEAAEHYERALSVLPAGEATTKTFNALVECLSENQEWERLQRALEAQIGRLHDAGAEPGDIAEVIDRRADVLRERLGRTAESMHLYEEAQRIDPGNRRRRDMLTAIYSREPKRYFQQAVAAHRALLSEEPLRVASFRALRRIYTSVKRPDESWSLCQALRCMGAADAEEERFFKKYRLTRLAKVRRSLDEPAWRELLVHSEQDPGLTAVFSALLPAILESQARPLSSFGVDPAHRADPDQDPAVMARMLGHVARAMGTPVPPLYRAPEDAGGLSFLFTTPTSIGIGQGALAEGPQQALAFVAARHLSFYRGGALARQMVPTGTGLRGWILAAIRLVSRSFPVPASMEGAVAEYGTAIAQHLTAPQKDALRSYTHKLVAATPELDVKRWVRGVDLTADRIGFALSNDLKVATAVVQASPEDAAAVSRQDRSDALLAYSVSEPYLELRRRLGIALGG